MKWEGQLKAAVSHEKFIFEELEFTCFALIMGVQNTFHIYMYSTAQIYVNQKLRIIRV